MHLLESISSRPSGVNCVFLSCSSSVFCSTSVSFKVYLLLVAISCNLLVPVMEDTLRHKVNNIELTGYWPLNLSFYISPVCEHFLSPPVRLPLFFLLPLSQRSSPSCLHTSLPFLLCGTVVSL